MLWVLWPFPLYFVFVYSMKFEDWVFRKEDSQRFRELVGSGPPGSSTQTGSEIAGGESLMDTGGGVTILVSVVAYMGICVVVGLWALRRTRSSADFFMAGRNLGRHRHRFCRLFQHHERLRLRGRSRAGLPHGNELPVDGDQRPHGHLHLLLSVGKTHPPAGRIERVGFAAGRGGGPVQQASSPACWPPSPSCWA